MPEDINRLKVFLVVVLGLMSILGMRLAKLQLIDASEYSGEARSTAVRENRVSPARGLIYDRTGDLVVGNEPAYSVRVTPRFFQADKVSFLAEIMGVSDSVITAKLVEARDWSPLQPSTIFSNVEFEVIRAIEENQYLLPGISYETSQKRTYESDARMSHVLGYVREISQSELNRRRTDGYRLGDMIGRAGLERGFERYLRGKLGFEYKLVDVHGREVSSFREGAEDLAPESGYDLHLTIDSGVQALAESLFVNKRGSAIAIDPATGELLALVSHPDIHPQQFSGSVSTDELEELLASREDPFFNRATMSGIPPGSTWKPFMALIGLELGVITADSDYYCPGGYQLGNRFFRDFNNEKHERIAVREAIQRSCNSYFWDTMMNVGLDRYTKWAKEFGFGERFPTDLPEQDGGLIPDSSYYDRVYKRWTPGYTINLGIGQGDMLVTPLQLARYVAAIANGGHLRTPHLVSAIRHPATGEIIEPEIPPSKKIPIRAEHFQTVREGMRDVMRYGSAKWVAIPDIEIAGKTGTAQAPMDRKDHSLFVMFAPFEDPEIAIAVMVENGGFGATQAAPIASLMAEKYLTGGLSRTSKWRKSYVMDLESQSLDEK